MKLRTMFAVGLTAGLPAVSVPFDVAHPSTALGMTLSLSSLGGARDDPELVEGPTGQGPAPSERRGASADRQQAPWFGIWQLRPPKSTGRFDQPLYKKVTSRIEPWEDGLKVVYDMVRTRGGLTHMEWTGRFDGRDYPVQGVGYFLTNAYRLIDDRSYEIVIKVDGKAAATARAVVSPDGATLTVTTVEQDARGQTGETTAVYQKQ